MLRKSLALLAGPIILMALGFLQFGEWFAIYAFVLVPAFAVFVLLLGAGTSVYGGTLPKVLLISNAIPLGYLLMECTGKSCRELLSYNLMPYLLAPSFCGFTYWLIAKRQPLPYVRENAEADFNEIYRMKVKPWPNGKSDNDK